MMIITEHATEGHDHGDIWDVQEQSRDITEDGRKERLLTDKGTFERYLCYADFSPYGWRKVDEGEYCAVCECHNGHSLTCATLNIRGDVINL